MRAVFVALLLAGCSGAQLKGAVPPPGRALCYARAELRAESRANSECPVDQPFASCPAHDDIMNDFRSAQEACK